MKLTHKHFRLVRSFKKIRISCYKSILTFKLAFQDGCRKGSRQPSWKAQLFLCTQTLLIYKSSWHLLFSIIQHFSRHCIISTSMKTSEQTREITGIPRWLRVKSYTAMLETLLILYTSWSTWCYKGCFLTFEEKKYI